MSRWSQYDTDEERLPEGMTRVGYDADEQVYTFRDADGSYWESAPGNQYGRLTRVSGPNSDDDNDASPFLPAEEQYPKKSWRHDMMPLLNFFVLVGVALMCLFWYLHWVSSPSEDDKIEPLCALGRKPYAIHNGDTCWAIAEKHKISVEDLLRSNTGLDCDSMKVDDIVCVPTESSDEKASDDKA